MSGAKGKSTKKHHYVPQLYLRKFANSEEQVYVFEKDQKKSHQSNIVDVAQKTINSEKKKCTHIAQVRLVKICIIVRTQE